MQLHLYGLHKSGEILRTKVRVMIIDPREYVDCESILQNEIRQLRILLPCDDIDTVEYYLSNAEIEMALESLGLSLMQNQVLLQDKTSQTLRELGLRLSLDKESVFDDKFWLVFTNYLNANDNICDAA